MNLQEYYKKASLLGKVFQSSSDHFWLEYESKAAARTPAFNLTEVTETELEKVFRALKPYVITYNSAVKNKPNAYLYQSVKKAYSVEHLEKNARRDARLACRNLEFRFAEVSEISEKGFKAYCNTRTRNGLSDGTEKNFEKSVLNNSAELYKYYAAITSENDIAAYLTIIEVDDWAEITGSYSADEYLKYCPANGLFHSIQEHYFSSSKVNRISYGVSSIQSESNVESLHKFKIKVGFEAVPVERIFILRKDLKPFVNKLTYKSVKAALNLFPKERKLRKLEGAMKSILYP